MREERNRSSNIVLAKTRYRSEKKRKKVRREVAAAEQVFDRTPHQHERVRAARTRILAVMFLVLCIEAAVALFSSPVFAVRKVHIIGLSGLLENESALTRQAISIKAGTNWLLAPSKRIEQRVKNLPWIREVSVTRSLPADITVKMVLREPVITLQSGSELFEMDDDEVPIRIARTEKAQLLPRVEFTGLDTPVIGHRLHSLSLKTIIDKINSDNRNIIDKIAKIDIDQNDNICLNMKDGIRIIFGPREGWQEKIALANRLYKFESNPSSRFESLNFTVPSSPVCVLKDSKKSTVDPKPTASAKL